MKRKVSSLDIEIFEEMAKPIIQQYGLQALESEEHDSKFSNSPIEERRFVEKNIDELSEIAKKILSGIWFRSKEMGVSLSDDETIKELLSYAWKMCKEILKGNKSHEKVIKDYQYARKN